jgi:peptidoglycan-associated lipoprotein
MSGIKQFRRLGAVAAFLVTAALAASGCGPAYPKCDDDNDCQKNEFCVNGMCQQCRTDSDCTSRQRCASGRCEDIAGYCTTTGECGVNEECQANRCVAKAQETAETPQEPEMPSGPCSLKPVYFDFDSSDLTPDTRDAISRNASCLRELNVNKLHLTGLTDPRGTEEYNLALGERRALAAKKYLQSLSTGASLSHSSMGEEMAKGTDESGWSQDRRVEFKQ